MGHEISPEALRALLEWFEDEAFGTAPEPDRARVKALCVGVSLGGESRNFGGSAGRGAGIRTDELAPLVRRPEGQVFGRKRLGSRRLARHGASVLRSSCRAAAAAWTRARASARQNASAHVAAEKPDRDRRLAASREALAAGEILVAHGAEILRVDPDTARPASSARSTRSPASASRSDAS